MAKKGDWPPGIDPAMSIHGSTIYSRSAGHGGEERTLPNGETVRLLPYEPFRSLSDVRSWLAEARDQMLWSVPVRRLRGLPSDLDGHRLERIRERIRHGYVWLGFLTETEIVRPALPANADEAERAFAELIVRIDQVADTAKRMPTPRTSAKPPPQYMRAYAAHLQAERKTGWTDPQQTYEWVRENGRDLDPEFSVNTVSPESWVTYIRKAARYIKDSQPEAD